MGIPLFESEVEYRTNDLGIKVIRRESFARDYFHYSMGEHVVFGGPTQQGKTTLAFDLLKYEATAETPAFVAVSKPNDPTTAKKGAALGFRRVSEYPPPTKIQEMKIFGGQKPPGFLIWSEFGDMDKDMYRCAVITYDLLMDQYAKGANPKFKGGILVMDDTMVKAKILGLDNQMVVILAMAGAMKLGLWLFIQKPTDSGRTTLWGYENATHVFFTKGGDDRMQRRYLEILGENGPIAKEIIKGLKPFQFLYVHRSKGYVCVVDSK